MKNRKNSLRRGANRWLAAVGMLVLSVGLVVASGWGYTAVKRPWLTAHSVEVAVTKTATLEAPQTLMDTYGVQSASQALAADGQTTGYAVVVARQGYKSLIRLQCTFTADGGTLADLRVLSQDETEYLGTRIMAESFTAGFTGRLLPVKLWTTAAPGSPVDGLTGSTISAQAVVDGVNNAHRFLQDYLAA